jgi:hypothetical protein
MIAVLILAFLAAFGVASFIDLLDKDHICEQAKDR